MKKLFVLVFLCCLFWFGTAEAVQFGFGWQQPDLAIGNTVFYGWRMWYSQTSGGPYTQLGPDLVWDGTVTPNYAGNWELLNPPPNAETRYYFVVNAWNKTGTSTPLNSGYSNEVTALVDLKPPTVPVVTTTVPPFLPVGNFTINGTKEAGSSVWVNGSQRIAASASTTWTTTLVVAKGPNNYSITSKDATPWLNESAALSLSFQGSEAPAVPVSLTVTVMP